MDGWWVIFTWEGKVKSDLDNKLNPASLCFDTRDDAFNYASKIVEDSKRRCTVYNVNLCQRYEDIKLEVDLHCRSVLDMSQYHFIFRVVPYGRDLDGYYRSLEKVSAGAGSSDTHGNRCEDFMFVGITQLVQGPQKIIPSFVWLARNHVVKDVFGDVLRGLVSSTLDLSQIETEGEVRFLSGRPSGNSTIISSLVEGGSKIANNIESNAGQNHWHGLSQFDFIKILSSVGILFHSSDVWIAFDKSNLFPLEFCNATLGVCDAIA